MDISQILNHATQNKASDIFIVAGLPLTYKVNGRMVQITQEKLLPQDTETLIRGIYRLAQNRDYEQFFATGDDDFSFSLVGISRFRASAYKQRGSAAAVVRIISFQLPDPQALGIPQAVISLTTMGKGLVLITGPAGSGKSTTLACMINHINKTQHKHIITLEDPLEHLHSHKKSIVSQREISSDTADYVTALRASLRQSPDVILLGELRDFDTIDIAMTAAETGHLILSTLHTLGAADTIDRVIDVFPPNQQNQIAVQLSMCLGAVVSQQLIPDVEGRLIPVFEIMTLNPGIRNMIRENKIHQIEGMLYSANQENMISMDNSLLSLVSQGRITKTVALDYATNPEMLKKKLG